ncbi:MAG TPA: exodeoxyribonuclease VII large subunit [Planctomycetota bacterium]
MARDRRAFRGGRPLSRATAEPEALSVSQAVDLAQQALDGAVGSVWIEGEVFGWRGPHASGHLYFAMRDGAASLDVKMWRGVAAHGLRCTLEEGRAVRALGHFDIWAKNGRLSFLLEQVEDRGAGDLARRFEELKVRLREEGLFDAERKRALPVRPRTVVLLTAYPSAAAADVLRTFEEQCAPSMVWLRPTRVQGESAVPDLVRGLEEAAAARPDLVLLTRGGGSLEDLWAFNEEAVVRAVAACPVPVLCAVGHESDFTLAELAADERAKTPTAAAARIVAGWQDGRRQVLALAGRFEDAGLAVLDERKRRVDRLGRDLRDQRPQARLARSRRAVYEAETRLVEAAARSVREARVRAVRTCGRLVAASPARRLGLLKARLLGLGERLAAGSPEALLARGYALVEVEGRPGFLRDPAAAAPGERLSIQLARGRLAARVEGSDA